MVRVLIVLAAVCAVAYGKFDIRIPSPRLDGRIIGGHKVDIKEVPYQASVQKNGEHHCGGSIISDSWVMTAGHCMKDSNPSHYSVRVGSSIHNSGGSVHNVVKIIIHPQHGRRYDYALIKVGTRFMMSDAVRAIKLAVEEPAGGVACILSGWGDMTGNNNYPKQLRAVELPIVDRDSCKKVWVDLQSIICAGEVGKSACGGDSGGPLVCKGVLAGVVSAGGPCGGDIPGYYSSIAHARKWIFKQTGI